jgi:hypothetical protein
MKKSYHGRTYIAGVRQWRRCYNSWGYWLETAKSTHGHSAINLVGRASSDRVYVGPTISVAMQKVASKKGVDFGCVCIAERHTIESAMARGQDEINRGVPWNSHCVWFDTIPKWLVGLC